MTNFIAEVSSNHHRDLERCYQFIDTATAIGCSAVKFQLFRVRELFAREILDTSIEHRNRERLELPVEFLPMLFDRCVENGVEFACTPFYLQAVKELEPYVAFFKIASYELLWDDLLTECALTGKPIVLSTGMATLSEIRHAVEVLKKGGAEDVTLLHCVSGYPTPPEHCNLSAIDTIRRVTGYSVGWSDHSARGDVVRRAVLRWGASIVEFHLDLDGHGEEFKLGHCWLPADIAPVIAECSANHLDGNGQKVPTDAEVNDRPWRADPSDGLRPMLETRRAWQAGKREVQVKIFKD